MAKVIRAGFPRTIRSADESGNRGLLFPQPGPTSGLFYAAKGDKTLSRGPYDTFKEAADVARAVIESQAKNKISWNGEATILIGQRNDRRFILSQIALKEASGHVDIEGLVNELLLEGADTVGGIHSHPSAAPGGIGPSPEDMNTVLGLAQRFGSNRTIIIENQGATITALTQKGDGPTQFQCSGAQCSALQKQWDDRNKVGPKPPIAPQYPDPRQPPPQKAPTPGPPPDSPGSYSRPERPQTPDSPPAPPAPQSDPNAPYSYPDPPTSPEDPGGSGGPGDMITKPDDPTPTTTTGSPEKPSAPPPAPQYPDPQMQTQPPPPPDPNKPKPAPNVSMPNPDAVGANDGWPGIGLPGPFPSTGAGTTDPSPEGTKIGGWAEVYSGRLPYPGASGGVTDPSPESFNGGIWAGLDIGGHPSIGPDGGVIDPSPNSDPFGVSGFGVSLGPSPKGGVGDPRAALELGTVAGMPNQSGSRTGNPANFTGTQTNGSRGIAGNVTPAGMTAPPAGMTAAPATGSTGPMGTMPSGTLGTQFTGNTGLIGTMFGGTLGTRFTGSAGSTGSVNTAPPATMGPQTTGGGSLTGVTPIGSTGMGGTQPTGANGLNGAMQPAPKTKKKRLY